MALGEFALKKTEPFITNPATVTGTDARDTVNARYADLADPVTGFIAVAKSELNDAIANLEAMALPISVGSVAASGINVPDFTSNIPDFTDVFDAVFTATLDEFIPVFSAPANKPDTSQVGWQDETISLEADFVAAVAGWLASGESAIPAAVQAAIYDAAVLRLDEKKVDSLAEFDSVMASKAFSCPPGALAIHRARVEGEFGKAAGEVSAKIAERDMELTQANQHKAAELAQAYVGAAKQYLIEKNKFLLSVLETSVNLWLKEYDAAIKYLDAQVEAFKGQVEGYKAEAGVYQTEGDVFESKAKAYVAIVDGAKAKAQLQVDNIRLQLERYKTDSDVDLKEEELKIDAKKTEYFLKEKIAEAMAGYHAQMVASGMAGIHVSAGISASRSDSLGVSWTWGYSESLQESETEQSSQSVTAEL